MKNYYQILGLEEGATLDEIKAAYREYVVKFHPDKHNGDTFFKERFQEVQEAYDYLRTHYTGCNEFVDERVNTTVSSVKMPSSSDIEFTSSSKQVYEGDTVTLKWNVRFPCSISLNVDTDKSYFDRTRNDLPLHGSTEIHIGKVEEEVVVTLHCSINNRTISKEIHLIRNRTIDGFRGFLDCLEGPQEKGTVYGIGAWKVGEIKDTPYMQEAYNMGKMV